MQLSCDRRPWQGYPTAPGTRQKPYTRTKETKRDKRSHGNKKTQKRSTKTSQQTDPTESARHQYEIPTLANSSPTSPEAGG